MRYIPYVLIVILVLAAGLLAGMFLLGAPDPSSDVSAAVSRITTTTAAPAARCTVPTPAATSATSRRAFWSMCR